MRACLKNIRRLLPVLMLFAFLIAASSCGKVQGEEGIITRMRSELSRSDAETVAIECVEAVSKEGESLFFFLVGGEEDRTYVAASFREEGGESYEFVKAYEPMERGRGIRVLQWEDDYVFFLDNEACTALTITDSDGKGQEVSVEAHPFVYRLPNGAFGSFSYAFFDAEGNEIPQA